MRTILLAGCCVLAAAPAVAQVVRVSVSTAGVEANGPSGPPSISGTGRYVVFASAATNLVASDTNGVSDIFLRDRDTDADGIFDEPAAVATTRISVAAGGAQLDGPSTAPVMTPDGRYVAFLSTATNLVAGAGAATQIYRLDRTTGTVVRISQSTGGTAADANSDAPAMSANGNVVAFASSALNLVDDGQIRPESLIYVRDVAAGTTTRVTPPSTIVDPRIVPAYRNPSLSADGTRIAWLRRSQILCQCDDAQARSLSGGAVLSLSGRDLIAVAFTADGRQIVVRDFDHVRRFVFDSGAGTPSLPAPIGFPVILPAFSPDGRYTLTEGALLNDFDFGVGQALSFVPGGGAFSADGRWLSVVSGTNNLVGGDVNGVDDVFVIDLPDLLDADNDTMDDRWETLFGVTDPAGDPDADGQTNAQEENAGTHPNGQVRRFLAEGATGTFFHTAISLANPNPTLAATAVLTFDRGDGTRIRRPIAIPAGRSARVDVGAVAGTEATDVSTTVESDRLLGIEREMTWGTAAGAIYGSHAETATASPSTTWFLAEGSTVLGFDLFYLLQNPQATTAHTTVRFLLPSGTVMTRTYDLAPGSRTTLYVNQIAGLEETDVSGDISADVPIVVERSMYRNLPNQPFGLGSDSMGVPAADTSWFLAEGATGSFFDLYVLIANPGATDATVQAQYAKPDGSVTTQTYTVRAHSRFSVYVDAIPGLENSSVATTLTSTNAVPIVAERAMYWPGGFFDYYEGHSSAGSTVTALDWVVAGGAAAGGTDDAQTFILIANTENRAGQVTLQVLPDRNVPGPLPAPAVSTLPPNSRTTIPLSLLGGPFGVRVTSTGPSPVQLVVESAVYRSSGGVTWSAGSNAVATPLP